MLSGRLSTHKCTKGCYTTLSVLTTFVVRLSPVKESLAPQTWTQAHSALGHDKNRYTPQAEKKKHKLRFFLDIHS